MTEDMKKNVCKSGKCENCKGDECKKECENGHTCGSGECGKDDHECKGEMCSECN